MLNEKDIQQIAEKGISRELFLEQINRFQNGFPQLQIEKPATGNDGIMVPGDTETDQKVSFYDRNTGDYVIQKFVPASGAATRMFKDVFVWRDLLMAGVGSKELLEDNKEAARFFENIRKNAFWEDLKVIMDKDDLDADHLLESANYLPILDYLLFDAGLEYASLPKALIAFHRYDGQIRTAMEEQLVEGAFYAADRKGVVRIHFTLSPEHTGKFEHLLMRVREKYENRYSVKYEVNWSMQKSATDTIAVGTDNLPFRERDGSLLFRPGGHGALIRNLQDLEADIIFIKNIDNVVPDHLKQETIRWKKGLGGILIELMEESYRWLKQMDESTLSINDYKEALKFASDRLNIDTSRFPGEPGEGQPALYNALDRPIRVCGMVKNEGEPGGGPFWIKDPDGIRSLQIVEMSQINMDDPTQRELVAQATHFNPVDLVCCIKNHKGEVHDLQRFVDPETGFISHKSKDGKDLKALELPGLWNGAMAKWNTVFVEVPLITFNPVKTINDLLRPEHQSK